MVTSTPARISTDAGEHPYAESDVRAKESRGMSLPELLDQLELALTGTPARMSVCRALSDLNRRLGPTSAQPAARPSKSTSPRDVGTKPPPIF